MSTSARIDVLARTALWALLLVFLSPPLPVAIAIWTFAAAARWLIWQWVKGQDRRRGRYMIGASLGPDGAVRSASIIGGSERD